MTQIANLYQMLGEREHWTPESNPKYPSNFVELFDIGTNHQTLMVQVKPGDTQHLHYHHAGADIFLVLHGSGELHTGELGADGDSMVNTLVQHVKEGDLYSIKPKEIHGLVNTGDVDLVWLNIAPTAHAASDIVEVFI